MASTGSLLRELREQRGVSLEELARSTRISPRFLAALEVDDLAALPPGPFARGFIRAYCQALGALPDEVLAQYSITVGAPAGPRPTPSESRPLPPRSRAPVLISLALVVGLGLALAAVTLTLRPYRDDALPRPSEVRSHASSAAPYTVEVAVPAPVVEPRPTVPGVTSGGAATAPPTPQLGTTSGLAVASPAPVTPRVAVSPARSSPAPRGKSYRLVARTSQSTRIQVRLDGRRTVEETIPAGAVREWISSQPFELRIANAGAVTLELNGRVLPPLGARGTTVHRLILPKEPR